LPLVAVLVCPIVTMRGWGGRLLAAKRDGDRVLGRDRQGLLQELEELKKLKKAVD
jgi:hypothetical protein